MASRGSRAQSEGRAWCCGEGSGLQVSRVQTNSVKGHAQGMARRPAPPPSSVRPKQTLGRSIKTLPASASPSVSEIELTVSMPAPSTTLLHRHCCCRRRTAACCWHWRELLLSLLAAAALQRRFRRWCTAVKSLLSTVLRWARVLLLLDGARETVRAFSVCMAAIATAGVAVCRRALGRAARNGSTHVCCSIPPSPTAQ